MSRLLILATILAGLLFASGCTKAAPAENAVYVYATDEARAEFITAFTTEPACHGVTVVSTLSENASRLHYSSNWHPPYLPQHYGFIAASPTDIDFAGETAQDAVRQACAILNRKGGTVR